MDINISWTHQTTFSAVRNLLHYLINKFHAESNARRCRDTHNLPLCVYFMHFVNNQ